MDTNEKDAQLIALLQANARMPVSEIARRLAVSRTAAQVRLEKLERTGVIDGYTVRLSSRFQRNQVRALVMIKSPPANRSGIEKALADLPQLVTLYSISGAYDLTAVISANSVEDLDSTIDRIGHLSGVSDTMSSIILSTKFER